MESVRLMFMRHTFSMIQGIDRNVIRDACMKRLLKIICVADLTTLSYYLIPEPKLTVTSLLAEIGPFLGLTTGDCYMLTSRSLRGSFQIGKAEFWS
jgi:hypothetical protein